MIFDWSEEKNEKLRRDRDISFEEIVVAIEEGQMLDILEHPNPSRYEGQQLYIVSIDDYAWVVPFVDRGDIRFLKTAFPSRKLTKRYLHDQEKERGL
ncbi:MAG: toxin [Spirochaetia bacterium]